MVKLKEPDLIVKAFGKINLTLEVIGIRDDGYHEIRSIMQNIELHDKLYFCNVDDNRISLSGNNLDLSYGEDNLIFKAARLLQDHAKINKGADIYLEKNIPIEAGLAGGSSDAAATLKGLNQLWSLGFSIEELMELGAKIGSDIPFCLVGDTALVEGRGEIVSSIKKPVQEKILIVKPDFGASTKLIYDKFDEIKTNKETNYSDLMINAINYGENYKKYLYNDLEKVTAILYPEVQEILNNMKQRCKYAMMSGSGPTCFAFGDEESIKFLYNSYKQKYDNVFINSFKK